MPRLQFTADHLAILAPALQHPVVQSLVAVARPIKVFEGATPVLRRVVVAPPSVTFRTAATPTGIPMHGLLQYLQGVSPQVGGVSLRSGALTVAYSSPPDQATQDKVNAALADQAGLGVLAGQWAQKDDPASLRTRLLDGNLADAEWLKLFRQYQVAQLAGRG